MDKPEGRDAAQEARPPTIVFRVADAFITGNRDERAVNLLGKTPFAYKYTSEDTQFKKVDRQRPKRYQRKPKRSSRDEGHEHGAGKRAKQVLCRHIAWERTLTGHEIASKSKLSTIAASEWPTLARGQLAVLLKMTRSSSKYTAKELFTGGSLRTFPAELDLVRDLYASPRLIAPERFAPRPAFATQPPSKRLMKLAKKHSPTMFGTATALAALAAMPCALFGVQLSVSKTAHGLLVDFLPGSAANLLPVRENARYPQADEADEKFSPCVLAQGETVLNAAAVREVLSARGEPEMEVCRLFNAPEGSDVRLLACGSVSGQVKVSRTVADERDDPELLSDDPARDEFWGSATSRVTVKARCAIQAISESRHQKSVKSWRSRIQNGGFSSLFVEILHNNAYRLARLVCEAALTGVTECRILLTSTARVDDKEQHGIIAVKTITVRDLAAMLNFQESRMWGIIEHFSGMFADLPEGDYVVYKEPFGQAFNVFERTVFAPSAQD